MRAAVFFFLILVASVYAEGGFLPGLEANLEGKFSEYAAGIVANWLESFNDEHLGKSAMGRFLHYDEMKTQLQETQNRSEGRGTKKMGTAMMPVVFHMGATSTWMLLTTILAAKSVAVGLALLAVKIATGSAKLASFFTDLKHAKPNHDRDHPTEPLPEHHGTISTISQHIPQWTSNDIPHHFHEYKDEFHDIDNNINNGFQDFNDYKTISTHGFGDSYSSDLNDFDGAKKRIDTKVG